MFSQNEQKSITVVSSAGGNYGRLDYLMRTATFRQPITTGGMLDTRLLGVAARNIVRQRAKEIRRKCKHTFNNHNHTVLMLK